MCGRRASYRRCVSKYLISSVGTIEVERRYYSCRDCGAKQVPWDRWAGVDHRQVTPYARRLVVLVGSMCSFDRASKKLEQLCRMCVNNDTIRRICDEEGLRVQRWLAAAVESVGKLKASVGHWEFYTDGLMFNTVEGWREMRLSILCRREAGAAAAPAQWKDRVLPEVTARWALGKVADSKEMGRFWGQLMRRVGVEDGRDLSVVADGAKYIWQEVTGNIGSQAERVVDVFHVSEHIYECGKALWGDEKRGRVWADERLTYGLNHDGVQLVNCLRKECDGLTEPTMRGPLEKLVAYLEPHQDDMWYRQRLERGLVIGSGVVEGACKNLVAARLKTNSCRWRVERAEHMAALRSLDYAGLVDAYWNQRAA